jgi:hypothetical protein
VVLVLYGNETRWTISNHSRNIRAIFVHGKDATLRQSDDMQVVAHMDTKRHAYAEVWGSSFNPNTPMTIGLAIAAIVDSTDRPQIKLNDSLIAALPRCEGRVRTHCRTREAGRD